MCDPVTIAGIALTAGSAVVNGMAASKAAKARDDVLAAERIRQQSYDQEASALNTQSQDRYQNFQGQQDAKANSLADYFTGPATAGAANEQTGATMPSSTSSITVREQDKQAAKAKAFTDQQGTALGTLRSFGDVLGDIGRLQARDAGQIGQIGGFKRGSSSITPYELDQASHAGDKMKLLGDLLGGAGSIATGYGLTAGPAAAGTVKNSGATLAAGRALDRASVAGYSLYPKTTLLRG